MSRQQPGTVRKPAAKFAHLKRKLIRNKVAAGLIKRNKKRDRKN